MVLCNSGFKWRKINKLILLLLVVLIDLFQYRYTNCGCIPGLSWQVDGTTFDDARSVWKVIILLPWYVVTISEESRFVTVTSLNCSQVHRCNSRSQ